MRFHGRVRCVVRGILWLFVSTVLIPCLVLFYKMDYECQSAPYITQTSHQSINNYSTLTYEAALRSRSQDNLVMLSLVDMSCIDMALNFWITSIKPYSIDIHLFIGSDSDVCNVLFSHNIPCFTFSVESNNYNAHASVYTSGQFIHKMFIRTRMILTGLNFGLDILHTDIDVVFMLNPLEDLRTLARDVELAVLWDYAAFNAGFLLARSSPGAIAVYKMVLDIGSSVMDQVAFNQAIQHHKASMKIVTLSDEKYLCGKKYWEENLRTFASDEDCATCIVVHNNWILTVEAKIYRFREMHMWQYDGGTKRYYSDPCRKYLTFKNPWVNNQPVSAKLQLQALTNAFALSQILNRTLILPDFHGRFCSKGIKIKRCSIISKLKIGELQAQFPDFREHSFLGHPLVPAIIKHSISKTHLIAAVGQTVDVDVNLWKPRNPSKGATEKEILSWFGHDKASVLQFHSLFGGFCCFDSVMKQQQFAEKIKKGFVRGTYRQYDV